jgi:succinylglutamic semialdehyde dehydrogenase
MHHRKTDIAQAFRDNEFAFGYIILKTKQGYMMEMMLRDTYYNGEFHKTRSKDEVISKVCPADINKKLWVANVDYSQIDAVIESAITGFETWRKTRFEERINYLKKYADLAIKNKEKIAMAIALETGKPLWESETEASAIAAKVNVTINDSLKRIEQETIKEVLPHIDGHTIKKPIGPTLVIGPFNFPCHLANGQILSSLLAGNSIIFKPSEKTIYSSQLLIELFHEAGFPKGVVNFINGTVHTTQSLLKHPAVKGIYFTGSLAVGKKILESVGTDITKLVALELGGKNATILHRDTNIEHALAELLRACYLSSGQRCTSTSMIVIHKDIQDEFIDKFKKLTEKIIIDHPTEFKEKPFMGPIIDQAAVDAYHYHCDLGLKNGAELIFENKNLNIDFQGHYVSPTIHYLKEAKKENPFTQNEIFGPNCTFTAYDDIEEAIRIANISDYGLAASIFTQDKEIYKLALRDIDAGIINLNRSTVGASSRLPFGGVKNSGNFHPAAVSMIDHCVSTISSLETVDQTSTVESIIGLK